MTTLDDLLTATGHVPDPAPDVLTAGRLTVDATLTARAGARRPAQVGPRRRRWRVVALTAAAAAVVAVTPILAVRGVWPTSTASAATVLRQAGQAAAAQRTGWPEAAYWHSTSTYTNAGHTYRRDIWLGHRASSVLRDSGVGDGVLLALDPAQFDTGVVALTWDQLYALPTDPAALKTTLVATIHGQGNGTDAETFVIVGDLLRESPAPPLLRQALYEVAAGIPGVRSVGQVTDPAGRTGTVVERDGQQYVIDVATGQLLDDINGGTEYTYLTQGPATSAPTAARR